MRLNSKINSALLIALLMLGCNRHEAPELLLPVFGAKQLAGEDTLYHSIGDFKLINQAGEEITAGTVKNKIYVANFFFVSCQSICPEMSSNLKDVQAAFEKDPEVLILSHSVNPMHDTVDVLAHYAGTYGAKPGKWHLLTGNKQMIYGLAKNSYLVNALEDDGSAEGFLHSELFLLIDKKSRIRGMYDGTNKVEVRKLIEDINLLKQEMKS